MFIFLLRSSLQNSIIQDFFTIASVPFRNFLNRHKYDVNCGKLVELTPAVIMRRMTAVSTYKHWHYFDAYPPGYLRTSYRGDDIPSPWINKGLVNSSYNNWPMFNLISSKKKKINWTKELTRLSKI